MSHGLLFHSVFSAKEEGDAAQAADGRPPPATAARSRSCKCLVWLSLFRSDRPIRSPRHEGLGRRRRRQGRPQALGNRGSWRLRATPTAPTQRGSGKPPHSRMKLKRERCPKLHGVLPLKTPDLEPVLVRPGQARRRHEIKEDSGCIIAVEPSACPEDSAVTQHELRRWQQHPATGATLPLARPPMSGLYGTGFSTCVPRIPKRDAPVSNNCLPIRG
uniref:Uncharacterized protein n=1 Tax=Macrostomum lignano TaxID=282301 RepID=A0A1I8F4X7_9PLAT